MAWPSTESALLALAALSLSACAELGREDALFDERIEAVGLDTSRQYAVRVAAFVRGDEIGGHVVFFEVDGELNTATDPYFVPAFCSYFGPGPLRSGKFRIVADGPDGSTFVAQASLDRRERTLSLELAEGAAVIDIDTADDELTLAMERVRDGSASAVCPETRQERVSDDTGTPDR